MQTMLAYLGFWFILVNGWDKTGYQRFFSRNRDAFDDWKWTNFFGWLGSDVVRILLAYGVFFIPLMLFWVSRWLQEGYDTEEGLERPEGEQERRRELTSVSLNFFTTVMGLTLGCAIVAHLFIRFLGWTIGGIAAAAVIYLFGLGPKGIGARRLKAMMKIDDFEGAPVRELAP